MRNTPTELILLQIAEGLQNLAKNPDLSKNIQNAYALTEAEQKKYDEAKATMANADQFLADLKKQQDALANIDDRIAVAQGIEKSNEQAAKALNQRENECVRQESANFAAATANQVEGIRLQNLSVSLDDRASAVSSGEQEIKQIKADLKKRADKVKAETADL